ncbi:YybH family protein [Aliamphritea spongicola]|uniref:YybH family protein n=1 Tax=Aliamphritea spongicola TaxID=707589 RepID=UPI00196B8D65|nr:SgcJ/EcaC family oxidoreductase [Aliamphritea spongicola]MBN3560896.1 SgcJ/EcaC family oxidoreductase [Aliamphritea spongicola]
MSISMEVMNEIRAADDALAKAYHNGDTAGLAALYTKDGEFMAPNTDMVKGRSAIEKQFQAFMDMGVKEIKLETTELDGFGNTAFEIGNYILEDAAGKMLDKGNYMVIWKKEADQWKLHRDMISTNMPAMH